MSASIETPLSGAPDSPAQLPFLRAVLHAVTWKLFLAAQALALASALLLYLEVRGPRAQPHVLHMYLISRAVAAVFLMLAAVATDEAVRRGFRMWRVYPVALLAGSGAAAIAQWYVRSWLGLIDYPSNAGLPLPRMVLVAVDVAGLGGVALLAYLNRQSAQRMLAGVRAAELERVRIERRLIESRLATAQAQIDPESVLKQLTEIRNLYGAARTGANEKLETLIQELRASVAQSVAVSAPRESAP
jgi:hypothetical protein